MCGTGRARTGLATAAAVVLAAGLLASGCKRDEQAGPSSRAEGAVQSKVKSGPILRVESAEFTNEDLLAYIRATGGNEVKRLSAEAKSRLFDRFVDEKILLGAARQRNMSLTPEEKKAYLAKLASESSTGNPSTPPEAAASNSVFDALLVDKYTYQVVRDVTADESEIRSYYDAHTKDFLMPERVQVSQILVRTEPRAVAILRKIENAPEEEFRKAAREESAGPEAFKGGVMGVYKRGDLPYDMEKVIFALDEGKISRVVESSYGYHIFRLDRKFPPQLQTVSEAAAAVRARVLERKVKDALAVHLAGLKDTLSWQTFPENLFFAYQRSDQ